MKLKDYLGIGLIIACAIFAYLYFAEEPEVIKVPVHIKVPVPVVEVEHDTVWYPEPIPVPGKREIDSAYYEAYLKLKDSVARDSAFRAAIAIKEYREKVEDDTITINLYAKTRGDLLSYQIGYKTKPRTLDVDTVIDYEIRKKPILYAGAAVLTINGEVGYGPHIFITNKKQNKAIHGYYDIRSKGFLLGLDVRF